MIQEEAMQDRELSWIALIDSGTMPWPPKREQYATGQWYHFRAFPPKQWRIPGIIQTSVGPAEP